MRPRMEVVVLGAGVSGLTSAVLLIEAGFSTRVLTRDMPADTTSCAAGALWGPYLVTDDRVLPWAEATARVLASLAETPGAGVALVRGQEAARTPVSPPVWATSLPEFRMSGPDELPAGFACGWWYRAPIVDMPTYLRYLVDRFTAAGGRIERRALHSLDEALAEAAIVVNCTGTGARQLVPDVSLTATRGQVVIVENPGIDEFFAQHEESSQPTYVLPHPGHVVLGGSAEPGTDLRPDDRITEAIRQRCAEVNPLLADAEVLAVRVGLRPTRSRVRLDSATVDGRHVVSNYGHGGGGVTLSWGCAQDVLDLVHQAV